jgi:hypothetical protein
MTAHTEPGGIRGVWLTDPRDGLDHAWHEVVEGGRWKSRCPAGIVADPATLTDPEDEFGRCQACELVLALEQGTELADRTGDSPWRV